MADRSSGPGRRLLIRSVALAIGIVLALGLGEILVRIAGRVLHRRQVVASHPRLGWTGWPNLSRAAKAYSRGMFRLSTDSIGRRVVYPAGRLPAPQAPALLLVGDSFVQGIGVEDEETLGWHLAIELPDRRVVNLGVAGYGTDQMLLSIEEFVRTDSATVRDIVVLTYENDFRDVQNTFDYALARSKPVFRLRAGKLERDSYAPPFLDRLMDRSELAWLARSKIMYALRPPEVSQDGGVELVIASLAAIREAGSVKGARVHVFAYRLLGPPFGFPSEVSDSTWQSFIRRSGAVDLTAAVRANPLPNPVGFDRLHWSAEGHRRAARRMIEVLAQ